jgi:hypothetical protein
VENVDIPVAYVTLTRKTKQENRKEVPVLVPGMEHGAWRTPHTARMTALSRTLRRAEPWTMKGENYQGCTIDIPF